MSVTEIRKEHEIKIIKRKEMSISGVEEVISFDEESVRLMSIEGEIYIEGEDIKIGVLDTDRGLVTLSGKINGFYYVSEDKGTKKGFFSRFTR
jgi:sporulation protein YabP